MRRMRRMHRLAVTIVALLLPAGAGAVDIFLVTNTNDAGVGSLRQAILNANNDASPDPDRIVFSIPGGGVKTIAPISALPDVTGSGTTIDGLTQPGASCASWPPTLRVVLNGSAVGFNDGVRLRGNGHTVQGLVVNGFASAGIEVVGFDVDGGHTIRCNFFGTNTAGSASVPNGIGIFLNHAVGVQVGGSASGDTNLISGNNSYGVAVLGDDNAILGNFIGTDVGATFAIPNPSGIRIDIGTSNTIGGLLGVGGNVIAGNQAAGISIVGPTSLQNLVIGNWIGVNTALQDIPNQTGVAISGGASGNLIGFFVQGAGNFIVANAGHGVQVLGNTSLGNLVSGNSTSRNGLLGIKLGAGALPNPNDPGDADVGPNRLQNHPVVTSAVLDDPADELNFEYSVPSDPANSAFDIGVDVYIADADAEEGIFWIGRVSTDGGPEMATLAFPFNAATLAALGGQIVATATDFDGNTSEFSPPIVVPEPGSLASGLAGCITLAALRRGRRRYHPRGSTLPVMKARALRSAGGRRLEVTEDLGAANEAPLGQLELAPGAGAASSEGFARASD